MSLPPNPNFIEESFAEMDLLLENIQAFPKNFTHVQGERSMKYDFEIASVPMLNQIHKMIEATNDMGEHEVNLCMKDLVVAFNNYLVCKKYPDINLAIPQLGPTPLNTKVLKLIDTCTNLAEAIGKSYMKATKDAADTVSLNSPTEDEMMSVQSDKSDESFIIPDDDMTVAWGGSLPIGSASIGLP
jgi:hypothetical protein